MKNKILVLLSLAIFLQFGCKKEISNNEEVNSVNSYIGLPSLILSTHHNSVIFGDQNSFAGFFYHNKSCMGQIIKSDNSGTVQCGDISLNGNLLPKSNHQLNIDFENQNWFNQTNNVSLGGLSSENFAPVTQQVNFVKPLVFSKPTPNRQMNYFYLGQPVEFEWEAVNPDDDMVLEIRSQVLPTPEQVAQGVKGYYTTLIKDIGNFTLPASLISEFNTVGGIRVAIYRFNNEEIISGNRIIDCITYSSFAGLVKFKQAN